MYSMSFRAVARVVIVALVLGAWIYFWQVKADAAVVTSKTDDVSHCNIPWNVANGGYNVEAWCKKHDNKSGKMDPKLKYVYKCGGAAVIATWFVRKAAASNALGALAACAWGSLFESSGGVAHATKVKRVRYALRSPCTVCSGPVRAVRLAPQRVV